MNISIVILNTGDQIICDLKEVYDGEGENRKGICLLMVHPYTLGLVESDAEDLHVRFSKWCPYSIDTQFKIPYATVVAVGQCNPSLTEAYLNKIKQVDPNYIEENDDLGLVEVSDNE